MRIFFCDFAFIALKVAFKCVVRFGSVPFGFARLTVEEKYCTTSTRVTCIRSDLRHTGMKNDTGVLPFRFTCPISIFSKGNSSILPKRHTIRIGLNEDTVRRLRNVPM